MKEQHITEIFTELEREFTEVVDDDTLRAVVEAQAHRYAGAPVQDFVPLALHRGVVAAGGGHRDDQLLPVFGANPAEEGRGGD